MERAARSAGFETDPLKTITGAAAPDVPAWRQAPGCPMLSQRRKRRKVKNL